MNPLLKFDFTVNKEKNTIHVEREFNADLNLVWEAWTNPEILDQWWAPKPYQTKTKTMDFRSGGLWLYSMISPQNETHWCRADYKEFEPMKSYSYVDNFCDENGNVGHPFPNSCWTNNFSETGEITTVNITIQYESLGELEKIIEVGFKEGFTMAMENLDQYIESKF
ncbi:MAG: SRPBCC domain-containing protein [Fluviicola sp.]